MIIVTKRPSRNMVGNQGNESLWNCARQPILFELQRRDLYVYQVAQVSATQVVVRCEYRPEVMTGVSVGDQIYFESTTNAQTNISANYGVSADIVSITISNGRYDIVVNYPPEAPITYGGFANVVSRANYYVVVTIYVRDANTGTVHPVLCRLKPAIDGRMRLDASEFITGYMDKILDNITGVNERDNGAWGSYYISWAERWTGYSGEETVDPVGTHYFVDAVKELQSTYGQNLLDYLPFPTAFTPYAKFLTDFAKPSYFIGYPFDISFIYPSEVSSALTREEDELTQSGSALSNISTAIDISKAGGVNRLQISGTGYSAGTSMIDLYIMADSIPQTSYYQSGYIASNYFELQPPTPPAFTPFQVTEKKRIKIIQPCASNPVYIRWRNTKGGWDSWLFDANQNISYESKQGGEFFQDPDEISTANTRSQVLEMKQVQRITCGGNVLIEDLEGIRGVEASPAVYMLVGRSPDVWMRMKVVPSGFSYQTRGATADIQVRLERSEYYNIPN